MATISNHYATLPATFYEAVQPATVPSPTLLAWNQPLATFLGLDGLADDDASRASVFAGNAPLSDAQPIALAYAGHQFGHFVPQLGDGRALLLGDVRADDGKRYDIQLKGSGRTPFSRGGDGKSWLGPVIREYLLSEAMHRLGVPTTRALAAVATGEPVLRESLQPGGVLTRVAASHIRVGTFQFFAARGDVAALRQLAEYAIERHYPSAGESASPMLAFFAAVCGAQARLVAHWMAVGFIHGVMNTDNCTVSGETIDYGPCAFMDEFRRDKVFSSIDRGGRYAYDQQPLIAQWNLARLAECLLLVDDNREGFEAALEQFANDYQQHYLAHMRQKLGLVDADAGDALLVEDWLQHLEDNELDYTLSFRRLAERAGEHGDLLFGDVEQRWRQRVTRPGDTPDIIAARMNAVNPLFIARNHQVERAIGDALEGKLDTFESLQRVLSEPYRAWPAHAALAEAPLAAERVTQTFCGT